MAIENSNRRYGVQVQNLGTMAPLTRLDAIPATWRGSVRSCGAEMGAIKIPMEIKTTRDNMEWTKNWMIIAASAMMVEVKVG